MIDLDGLLWVYWLLVESAWIWVDLGEISKTLQNGTFCVTSFESTINMSEPKRFAIDGKAYLELKLQEPCGP